MNILLTIGIIATIIFGISLWYGLRSAGKKGGES